MSFPELKLRWMLHVLTLLALLSPLANPLVLDRPEAVSAAPLPESEPFIAWIDLFRVWVTFPNASSRARLDALEVVVLEETGTRALILADAVQLETLARLRFRPEAADDMGMLIQHHADTAPAIAESIQPLLAQAQAARALRTDTGFDAGRTLSTRDALALQRAQTDLRATLHSLTVAQQADIMAMTSLDSDGDGLTDTEEYWWCTDPLNPDTKGDGVSDGDAVAALMAWMHNELPGPPASGTPFLGWPMVPGDGQFNPNCVDQDKDSVPDLAERWMLGLNPNRESTSRDKFDDGQKLFGITAWGWGALPRTEDTGIIFAEMPSWVKAPGNHPLVAAYPVPEIDVVPSSLRMETVTIVTAGHTISQGEERSYSTSQTIGQSNSVANTITWNEWEEASEAIQRPLSYANIASNPPNPIPHPTPAPNEKSAFQTESRQSVYTIPPECLEVEYQAGVELGAHVEASLVFGGGFNGSESRGVNYKANSAWTEYRCRSYMKQQGIDIEMGSPFSPTILINGFQGLQNAYLQSGQMIASRLYEIGNILRAPVSISTQTKGRSWGGAQTNT